MEYVLGYIVTKLLTSETIIKKVESKIIVNPMRIQTPESPLWLCSHNGAKVIDFETKLYECWKCNTKNGLAKHVGFEYLTEALRKHSDL